jgi:hypothetical protein
LRGDGDIAVANININVNDQPSQVWFGTDDYQRRHS